jgi:hypothetical protein
VFHSAGENKALQVLLIDERVYSDKMNALTIAGGHKPWLVLGVVSLTDERHVDDAALHTVGGVGG